MSVNDTGAAAQQVADRRYAEMFLDKEQIDEVDESKIPGYRA